MRIWLLAPALVALALPAQAQGASPGEHDALIARHAAANGVPEALVRRVIRIESRGQAHLVSKGNYGLMQIRLGTARAMGYSGTAEGLLDANTNMTYAVKYLAGAYRAAGGNADRAVSYYQRGYYTQAKAKGFSPYALASATPEVRPVAAPRVQPVAAPHVQPVAAPRVQPVAAPHVQPVAAPPARPVALSSPAPGLSQVQQAPQPAPAKRATASSSDVSTLSWYNLRRFFEHPAHKLNQSVPQPPKNF